MRKTIRILFSFVLAGALLGCTHKETYSGQVGSDQPSQQNPQQPSQSKPPSQDPQQPSQSQSLNNKVVQGWKAPGGKNLANMNFQNDAYQILQIAPLAHGTGFTVAGKLRAFEAVGAVVLKDQSGLAVLQPSGQAEIVIHADHGAPNWGNFTVVVNYPVTLSGAQGTLEFYVHSAKDGSKINILPVPISL
ncbi:Gmad2 immunoglobulin-like domain-containing protein [Effusibacillus lacus]|uniref:Bacterial spore germination immunoglobulin-like domain-containing protein n=1 Tax=Effusibacillus lacus TaxID=1348429 RepID=A0A292YTV8_9BACL|nr:Gmad2 immunoglobulin-like domain-containing protein [Effusibacillus lacus]GAX91925.1 hypothetical protein EFBL_3616 [Effusibacillus lacus]